MASIKICDRCKEIFADRAPGSSSITSGVVYLADGTTRNLAGDMCVRCTGEFTARPTMIGDRKYTQEELADEEKGWTPQ